MKGIDCMNYENYGAKKYMNGIDVLEPKLKCDNNT